VLSALITSLLLAVAGVVAATLRTTVVVRALAGSVLEQH
jgi:hypothetical protein